MVSAVQTTPQTLIVESIQLGLRRQDSASALRSMKLDVYRDFSSDTFVSSLRVRLAANTIWKEQEIIHVPSSWWQAFKERFFPPLFKRWFPIDYREIVAVTKFVHACPHIDVHEPKTHFAFLTPHKFLGLD